MKGKLLLIAVAFLGAANFTLAQPIAPIATWEWWRIDQGGSVEDLQLVYHDNAEDAKNQVWAAVMNTGLYRSVWDVPTPNTWNPWEEHKPSIKGYGVDAIEVGGVEHVLGAGGILGVWYSRSNQPGWDRPIPDHYPLGWKTAPTHDVAFYWPTGTGAVPQTPEAQYYVILNNTVDDDQFAGLYLWDDVHIGGFDPIPNQPQQPRHYSHFYRDIKRENANVLYVILGAKDGTPVVPGGLYKLSGDYGSTPVDVSPANTQEVLGFNQWQEGTTVTYYILIKNTDGEYWVYVTDTMDGSSWRDGYECNSDWFSPDPEWSSLYPDHSGGAGVIGRPHDSYHHLWIATPVYGLRYVDTAQPAQVTTIIGDPSSPALKRFGVRAYIPDSGHIDSQASPPELMRLLFGSHQDGVWYLRFPNLNTYTWEHLDEGFFAEN